MPMEAVILSQWRYPQDYGGVFGLIHERGTSGIDSALMHYVWDMAILEAFMHVALRMNARYDSNFSSI